MRPRPAAPRKRAPSGPLRVAIVTVGDEITAGAREDTHRRRLAVEVAAAGGTAEFLLSVPDDRRRIARAVREGLARADVVLMTGGLGATPDDVTRDALAAVFGTPLVEDPRTLARARALFRKLGRPFPPQSAKQALVPAGARLLRNPVGLAPGLHLTRRGGHVVALPGVPSEFDAMVTGSVRPLLARLARGRRPARREIRTIGIGEMALAGRIAPIVAREPALVVGYLPAADGVTLRLLLAGGGAGPKLAGVVAKIRRALGRAVYSTAGESLESVVLRRLARRGERLATAESYTGGLVAARLVSTRGASLSYAGGVIAYAPEEKTRALGVPARLLARYGAASEATAVAMARGARSRLGVEWGLSTTGVAGPGSHEGQPPGTVYAAVAGPDEDSAAAVSWRLPGPRDEVRARGAALTLDLLRRALLERG